MKFKKIIELKTGNRKKYQYNNIIFDSKGEIYFYWWLVELQEVGYVNGFLCYPEYFMLFQKEEHAYTKKLKTKNKYMSELLLPKHIYTPDFFIEWSEVGLKFFTQSILDSQKFDKSKLIRVLKRDTGTYIEVKPTFDQNNMTRLFKLNQLWTYQKYSKYINLVTIGPKKSCWFAKTFVPTRFLWTDTGKQKRKINYNTKTLKEFINETENKKIVKLLLEKL